MFESGEALAKRLILAFVAVLIAVLWANSLLHTQEADAGIQNPTLQCQDLNQISSGSVENVACVELTPKAGTNMVGEGHTVTATVSTDSGPLAGICLYILVIQGPNMGEQMTGVTDAAGQLSLTYTGSGPGIDMIGTEVALVSSSCSGYIPTCLSDPESCVDVFFNHPTCDGAPNDQYLCDNATAEWQEPTASPTATASASPTATATASPTATATASPTATATASPTATATASPGQQVIWGDANCSGSADPVDSLLTLRFDAGLSTNTGDCPDLGQVVDVQNASLHPWGDVDCGGEVTPVDSLKLLRFDAGFSVAQAEGCPPIGVDVTVVEG